MNVAVCAPVLDPASRSRSVASVLAAIAWAAERLPAPDLIVLPDCFAGGATAGGVSAAMCVGFCETIGRAAREWGLWIAVGHPTVVAGTLVSGASVFDPDADPYIRFPQARCLLPGVGAKLPAPSWGVRNTPLGRWALRSAQSIPTPPDWDFREAGLAILPARSADRIDVNALAAVAAEAHCALCVATPRVHGAIPPADRPLGAIIAAGGKVLGLDRGAGVISAELLIPVVADTATMEELGSLD